MLRSMLSLSSFLFHKLWVLSAIIESSLKIKNSFISNTKIYIIKERKYWFDSTASMMHLLVIIVAELTFGYVLSKVEGGILGCVCFNVHVLDIVQGTVQSRRPIRN